MTRALITGITGQDGSYMAELLLDKGYEVHGLARRPDAEALRGVIGDAVDAITLHACDLSDARSVRALVSAVRPDHVYNLAAQSHVGLSFERPDETAAVVAMGTLHLIDAAMKSDLDVRFVQASSSAVFGIPEAPVQDESTPFKPRSPYASAKAFAHHITVNYRDAYGMRASNAILFNHESPRRPEEFVTRKITRGIARIVAGAAPDISLGNVDVVRDWGYAPDYMEAMWLMATHDGGDDFVVATGEAHSLHDFLRAAFGLVGRNWEEFVRSDPAARRLTDVPRLCGNPARAQRELGWQAATRFADLVRVMLVTDLRLEGVDPARHIQT